MVGVRNPAQGLRARFGYGRVEVWGAHGLRLALGSLAVGRAGTALVVRQLGRAVVARNRVVLSSPGLREWFVNGPWGVEQGVTLERRPAGSGRLAISQVVSGDVVARVGTGGRRVLLSSPTGSLSYGGLVVTDARGRDVASRLTVAGDRLTISIVDSRAVYPLRVDPTIQQPAELTAADGAASDKLGYSVSVSGATIVAGAPGHKVGSNGGQGAVYVYSMPAAGGWVNAKQTAELTAADGAASDGLGSSVSVSGSTIVAGAPGHEVGSNTGQGAVYEWTLPASGVWRNAKQTAELTASDGAASDGLGSSVSASGPTIVAGAPAHKVGANSGQGAVYEWTMPASGGWADHAQTAELTGSDGAASDELGYSVGVSGSKIVAGAAEHKVGTNAFEGAVYEWTMPSSGGWKNSKQTAELTASDGLADGFLGFSVAVSGSTIVAGALGPDDNRGAVYAWTLPTSGVWKNSKQTAELTASDGAMQRSPRVLGSGFGVDDRRRRGEPRRPGGELCVEDARLGRLGERDADR